MGENWGSVLRLAMLAGGPGFFGDDMRRTGLCFGLLAVSGLSFGQYLLMPDSGGDRILKLSALDGSVVDANFIVDANSATTFNFDVGIEVEVVGDQIWVTDQTADWVFRFDHFGGYLGRIDTGLDNIRGLARIGNEVWVSNAGTANGAPGPSLVRYGLDGTFLGSISRTGGSPWDIAAYQGGALVSDSASDDIDRFDSAGNFVGTFHSSAGSPGIDFPQQIFVEGDTVFAAGFSLQNPGLYRFDSSGAQTGYWRLAGNLGARGVTRLGNGLMLLTGGTRLDTVDLVTGATVTLRNDLGASYRYLTPFTPIPEPFTMGVLALGAAGLAWRRRRSGR